MRVVVIGAGFAGLAAADELRRGGVEVVVLEARERVGGRVWSQELSPGLWIERGAEFVLDRHDVLRETVRRLGLTLLPKGLSYGNREPRGGIGVDAAEHARAVSQMQTALGRRPPEAPRTSVRRFLDELPIDPGAREAILARIQVSSAHSPEDLEVAVLGRSGGGFGDFESHTVAGGNQRIATELAAPLGDGLRLSAAAERVAWSQNRVHVRFCGAELQADAAVIAVPSSVLGAIAFDPPLPASTTAAVSRVRYGQAAKLFVPLRSPAAPSAVLSVPEPFWCFTQLGPDGRSLPAAGAFAGSTQALRALAVDDGPATWLAALRRLRPDLDLAGEGALLATWHDDRWARGAYSAQSLDTRPGDGEALARPVGPLHFCGEHTAGEWAALMEGALRSGMRAAGELLTAR